MSTLERIVAPSAVPVCPAADLVGEAAGGTGCECRVTRDLIDSRRNQSTLQRFCFNSEGYRACPTWQADKEALWATKTRRDLLNRKGDLVTGHPEDREREQGLELALDAQERDRWQSEHDQD